MPIDGTEPVSAADLNIALGGASSSDIGDAPVCVDDLKLAVDGMRDETQALLGSYAVYKRGGGGRYNNLTEFTRMGGSSSIGNTGSTTLKFNKAGQYRFVLLVINGNQNSSNTVYTVDATFDNGSSYTTLGSAKMPLTNGQFNCHIKNVTVPSDGAYMSFRESFQTVSGEDSTYPSQYALIIQSLE